MRTQSHSVFTLHTGRSPPICQCASGAFIRHHFGAVMAALFVGLMPALRGGSVVKGLAFGLMVWFLRVAMGVAAQAVMFNIPASALA